MKLRNRSRALLGALCVTIITAPVVTPMGAIAAGKNQEIRLFGNSTDKPATDALIKQFQEANPGIKVTPTYYGVSDGQAALMTQLLAGTAPEIIQAYPGSGSVNAVLQLAANNHIARINRSWANLVPKNDQSMRYLGNIVGVPMSAQGVGYIYSPEIMKKSGLTPPTKWSEIKPFCAAAKAKGTPAYGAAWATGWPTIMHSYATTATMLYAKQPTFTAQQYSGSTTFANSPWVKSLDMLQDMNSWGCFNASPNSTTYAMITDDLAKGKVLGWLGLPTIIPALTAIAPSGTTWDFAAHPATDNPKETIIPSAILRVYALNKKAERNSAAVKFMDFLATPAARQTFVSFSGGIPAGPVPGYQPSSPAIATIMEYRAKKKTFPFIDQQWRSPQVQQALIAGVQAIFAGTDTPKGVAEKMDKALQGK
jgi:raffinose/stachyose/melibiose transport system substrate-binding protein